MGLDDNVVAAGRIEVAADDAGFVLAEPAAVADSMISNPDSHC